MNRNVVPAISAVAAISAFLSCGGPAQPPAPPPSQWTPTVQRVESPAGPASAQPFLTASSRGVVLSWFENVQGRTSLKFASRTADGWSAARKVASDEDFFLNWADVPSVVRLSNGSLVAHWLRRNSRTGAGYDVEIATSSDDGQTWSAPISPHHDGTKTQHGFASLFETGGATPFGLVWLDGRLTTPAANPDDDAVGEMTLRSARYDASWQQQADDGVDLRVCDCCPTAVASTSDGIVVAYRDRSAAEIRDIYVTRLAGGKWSAPAPVHKDGWKIDGCPVNGPAISASGRDVAVAWFTAPQEQGHSFVAFSKDGGRTFADPIRVDDEGSLGRVSVAVMSDGSAVVSWIELANQKAALKIRRVGRDGSKSPTATVADITSRGTSYPRMVRSDRELVFAWPDSETLRVQTAVVAAP
jgi:BNR repeat-like domain